MIHIFHNNTKQKCRFVGIAEIVSHTMKFKILDDESQLVVNQSLVRSALTDNARNQFLEGYKEADIFQRHEIKNNLIQQDKKV